MSKIKNEPKIKNKIIAAVREQLEHRALWLYHHKLEGSEKNAVYETGPVGFRDGCVREYGREAVS